MGVAGAIRIRPRPSDSGGEAEETGGGVATVRGVVAGLGVVDGATDAAVCAGVIMVDGAEAGAVDAVAPAPAGGIADPLLLTNFFGGALGGGLASDFIFCRVLFASS